MWKVKRRKKASNPNIQYQNPRTPMINFINMYVLQSLRKGGREQVDFIWSGRFKDSKLSQHFCIRTRPRSLEFHPLIRIPQSVLVSYSSYTS